MKRGPVVGVSDLATTHPNLALEAHNWDPRGVTYGMGKSLEWKCNQCNQIYSASPNKRSQGRGCPVCSNSKIITGKNDLKSTDPELAALADGWDPSQFSRGSKTIVRWKCVSDKYPPHSYPSTIYSKTSGRGCSVCSGKLVIEGINDLVTTHPEIASEATESWDPKKFTAGSNKVVDWLCKKGHPSRKSINQRTQSKSSGCAICENLRVEIGYNDLASLYPAIAREAYGWNAEEFVASSEKQQPWKCSSCGFVWLAVIRSRTQLGAGCGPCAGNKLFPGVNDCKTTHPELAAQAFDWDPTQFMAGTGYILNWKCPTCNFVYPSTGSNRIQGQGCPKCAKSGFDPSATGWLYLIKNESKGLIKIGITNSLDTRLRAHRAEGFRKLDLSPPMPGHKARELEKKILQLVKTNKGKFFSPEQAGKFNGYTECWEEVTYPANSLVDLIRKIH